MGETIGPIDQINMGYAVFNELSIPFKTKYEAEEGLVNFVQTFAAASEIGLTQLRLHQNIGNHFYRIEIAPNYLVSNLLKTIANEDIKVRFKEILTSAPLITENEPLQKEKNERSSFEVSIDGIEHKRADGLGAAYLLETVALSFLSEPFWNDHIINGLKYYSIGLDGTDNVDYVSVRHASTPGHIFEHLAWVEKSKIKGLNSARELWERRCEFFPHLVLCGQVEQQLKTVIGIGSSHFNQILERLKSLNRFALDWTEGGFNDRALKQFGLNVTGETDQTMRKYGRERRFRLPGGRREYFEKHIKTGELRFHFFPDIEEHKIYVGYIGPHLRTVTYN